MAEAEFRIAELKPATTTPATERLHQLRRLACKLLRTHGLTDWTFIYNRRKRAMGFCCYSERTVELSVYFVARNPSAAIVDTLLHEIAHALVGPDHGHDDVWKAKCREVGANPSRLGQADMPDGKWQAACQSCGHKYHRHRRPKRLQGWYCPPCGSELGTLVWKQQVMLQRRR